MSLAKRSRNVEDDGRAEAEKIAKKSAAEEHIEDNAIFIVAVPVRSMCLCGDKFGESREAVHSELLTQPVAAGDVLGGGGPREARLQERDDDEKVGDRQEERKHREGR